MIIFFPVGNELSIKTKPKKRLVTPMLKILLNKVVSF